MSRRVNETDLKAFITSVNSKLEHLGVDKKVELDYAYGGVRVIGQSGDSNGRYDLSDRGTKRQAYDWLRAMDEALYMVRQVQVEQERRDQPTFDFKRSN